MKSQTITVPTFGAIAGFVATQNYTYDSLNRIKQATETIPSQTGWQQTFVYDRYGNRCFDTKANATTTLDPSCVTAVCNPEINTENNRLLGYDFDASGNTTTDASGRTFIYDAENKQVQVDGANGIVGQYYYDGDGKRIKKIVPNNTGEGHDICLRRRREAYSRTLNHRCFTVRSKDHLSNKRVSRQSTNHNRSIWSDDSKRDFLPFGEEIARANCGTDSVRQKFTGYERDNESNVDFAQARYYSRWTLY